jgi:hypothetical protein
VHERLPLDILLVVLILFAISIACFLALIGAAVAIVRHVRRSNRLSRTPAPPRPSFGEHLHAATEYGFTRSPRAVPHQTVQGITAKKNWNTPSKAVEIHPDSGQSPAFGRRKSPQSVQAAALSSAERADWTHFNKDFGDLTDPYTSRRPSRAASSRRF